MKAKSPKLVVVGYVAHDFTRLHGEKPRKLLGGAAYNACKAASLSTKKIGLVSRIGRDIQLAKLEELGIDLRGVMQVRGKSAKFVQHYDASLEVVRARDELNAAKRISTLDVPGQFARAPFVHISTMPPAVQKRFMEFFRKNNPAVKIGVDTSEAHLKKSPKKVAEALAGADFVFLNEREYALLREAGGVPHEIIIRKTGARGAELHVKGRVVRVRAPRVKAKDPTAAGDVLAGAFMALVSKGKSRAAALRRAVRLASHSVKDYGVEGI